MQKPDFLSDDEWAYLKDQTSSLQRIRSDGKADVEAYLANPDGRVDGRRAIRTPDAAVDERRAQVG